jgi:glycyl-tRNA synthetase alpha chain
MYLQDVDNIFDIEWVEGIDYGNVNLQIEKENSVYNFEESSVENLNQLFKIYENEAKNLIDKDLIFPAYDYTLKCSHVFNLLDARGAISVSERTGYISRVRDLARECAKGYVEKREALDFPLLKGSDKNE